jgi:hypothetical protein
MTIFTRTYDFISWLIPKTASFPRSHRFIVTKRLQDAALNFQEFIIEANRQRGRLRLDRLRYADADLDKVRLYLRLAVRWQWLTEGSTTMSPGWSKSWAICWGAGLNKPSAQRDHLSDGSVRGPVVETCECCVAAPGTTTRTTRAALTATGTTRTTGTTTTVFESWSPTSFRIQPEMPAGYGWTAEV